MSGYVFPADDPAMYRMFFNIGLPGHGKTTLLAHQLARIEAADRQLRRASRIIVIDPTNDSFHFGDFGREIRKPGELASVLEPENLPPPVSFKLRIVTNSAKFFDLICKAAKKLGDVWLLIDEVWMFCANGKAGSAITPESFNEVAVLGRHYGRYGVRIIGTAQRPTQIHNNLLTLANETNVFCTEDLERLKKKLRTKENMDAALDLPKREFFCCRAGRPPERLKLL